MSLLQTPLSYEYTFLQIQNQALQILTLQTINVVTLNIYNVLRA